MDTYVIMGKNYSPVLPMSSEPYKVCFDKKEAMDITQKLNDKDKQVYYWWVKVNNTRGDE